MKLLSWDEVDADFTKCTHRAGRAVKRQRSLNFSSATITLTHRRSGQTVTGSVPEAHYSKRQLRQQTELLYADLLRQLSVAVHRGG